MWTVELADDFRPELLQHVPEVRIQIAAMSLLLEQFGPQLSRPWADTLKGSKHANMKELRFNASGGVWRVAFAFDPKRQAILLIAGDKARVGTQRFYKELIRKADDRFDSHLSRLSVTQVGKSAAKPEPARKPNPTTKRN